MKNTNQSNKNDLKILLEQGYSSLNLEAKGIIRNQVFNELAKELDTPEVKLYIESCHL